MDKLSDPNAEEMPQYYPHENELKNVETFPCLEEEQEVTLEVLSIFECRDTTP